jgi:hypothetical protein
MTEFLAVYNPTEEEVTTMVNGSFFTWKPGQVKQLRANQAQFVDTNRQEFGLVLVSDKRFIPAEQDHYIPGFDKTPEGIKFLEPYRERGINNLVAALTLIIRNNQVSLRQDLANKYPTGDSAKMAAAYASPGELEAMRKVVKYKKKTTNNVAKQVEEIEKLMAEIGPMTT